MQPVKDTFLTISSPSAGEFRDRGSKFLAYAFPVRSEGDWQARLEEVRKEHPKARHYCYAFRLGLDENNYRANDDGEPSGTAGRPILGQIDSFNLTNVFRWQEPSNSSLELVSGKEKGKIVIFENGKQLDAFPVDSIVTLGRKYETGNRYDRNNKVDAVVLVGSTYTLKLFISSGELRSDEQGGTTVHHLNGIGFLKKNKPTISTG